MAKKESNPNPPEVSDTPRLQMPENMAGVVSLANWHMIPSGVQHRYIWAPRWEVITDKVFPVEGFRSAERWQLLGYNGVGELKVVLPGCEVKGWCQCDKPPQNPDVCTVA